MSVRETDAYLRVLETTIPFSDKCREFAVPLSCEFDPNAPKSALEFLSVTVNADKFPEATGIYARLMPINIDNTRECAPRQPRNRSNRRVDLCPVQRMR